MAGISVYRKTTSSVTLYLSGLDTTWEQGTRTVYWYLGSANGGIPTESAYTYANTTTLADRVSSGGHTTFVKLEAGTQYGVYCTVYHNSTLLGSFQGYVKTDAESGGGSTTNITKWSWNSSNGDATAIQTSMAYTAVVNKTEVSNFAYLVWNDIVDKVYELAFATVKFWDATYATYANTKMTSSDKTLTAVKFNSLRNNLELVGNNIGLGDKTGIDRVYPKDKVYGDYFTTLTEYINWCIENL